jgi:hypothetical protein
MSGTASGTLESCWGVKEPWDSRPGRESICCGYLSAAAEIRWPENLGTLQCQKLIGVANLLLFMMQAQNICQISGRLSAQVEVIYPLVRIRACTERRRPQELPFFPLLCPDPAGKVSDEEDQVHMAAQGGPWWPWPGWI